MQDIKTTITLAKSLGVEQELTWLNHGLRNIDQFICINEDGNKLSREIIDCLTVLISVDRAPKTNNS